MLDKLKALLSPRLKAVAALVVTGVGTYLATGAIDVSAVISVLAALGVYAVPNKPATK